MIHKILATIIGLLLLLCIILSVIPVKISKGKGQEGIRATEIKLPDALIIPVETLQCNVSTQGKNNVLSSGRLFGLIRQTSIELSPGNDSSQIIEEKHIPLPEITYHLQGVIQGSQGAIAVIRASNQTQNVFIKSGDTIGVYRVVQITKDSLVLKTDGQEKILHLEYPQ